jgi:hypothetical protein
VQLITILLGFIILVGGNQLYWLFVGAAGFFLGVQITELIGFDQTLWQQLTFALAVGLSATFLSYYQRKIMVYLAGFLAGGYFITSMPAVLGWSDILGGWQAFVLAGALTVLALILAYDLALIVISSLWGAAMIAQNLRLASISPQAAFVVLILFGVIAQWLLMQYGFRPGKS